MVPDFYRGHIIFSKGDKYGLMDSAGIISAPAIYTGIGLEGWFYRMSVGLLNDYKEGLLDEHGNIFAPAIYEHIIWQYEPKVYLLEEKKGTVTRVLTY